MIKVFDFCYNDVPQKAQKEFRKLMYEWDGGYGFMNSFYSKDVLDMKRKEALENT